VYTSFECLLSRVNAPHYVQVHIRNVNRVFVNTWVVLLHGMLPPQPFGSVHIEYRPNLNHGSNKKATGRAAKLLKYGRDDCTKSFYMINNPSDKLCFMPRAFSALPRSSESALQPARATTPYLTFDAPSFTVATFRCSTTSFRQHLPSPVT
jgi:hypothetical protein